MRMKRWATVSGLALVIGVAALGAGSARSTPGSVWGPPVNLASIPGTSAGLNTPALEGCPIESPDGKSLYFASNRSGNLDIWVSRRADKDAPWGAPEDLPAPVNSDALDFCPTPVPGNGLFFVSTRDGYCGGAPNSDIYFTQYNPAHGWSQPLHLPCSTDGGPNNEDWAMGPSYFNAGGHGSLYFSSGPGGTSAGHIYASEQRPDGSFGPAAAVAELNSDAADLRPNVSKDGREIVFDSTRAGGAGAFDIWTATRPSPDEPWSTPVDVAAVNSASNEHRASLSRDGKRLYFGSDRPDGSGSSDIYVSTRLSGGSGYVSTR